MRVPRAILAPRLDATWDDAAWNQAATIEELSLSLGPQAQGLEAPRTHVKLLWSPDWLWVRFIAWSDEIYAPFGTVRDAPHFKGDVSEVFIDPVGDARQWVELQCSPDNGVFDKLFLATAPPQAGADGTNTPASEREVRHSTRWQLDGLQTAAGRWAQGWLSEFAIPAAPLLKQLGQKQLAPMTMRANLLRYEWRLEADETRSLTALNWAPVKWGNPHRSPHAMGWMELTD